MVFDKLHVFYLGLIRNFTYLVGNVIQRNNTLPGAKLITNRNECYVDIYQRHDYAKLTLSK